MGQVKIIEHIYEVTREVYFDSFDDFMEYERVNNSRVEEKPVLKTSAEDDDWKDNTEGECPVDGGLTIEAELRDGFKCTGIAGEFYWHQSGGLAGDIIKYRIVEEEK